MQTIRELFEQTLFRLPSAPGLFNPYADRSDEYDVPDAVVIRRANLFNYLSCFTQKPDVFLLAEAPGPRGCRFSGVPITSEAQLMDPGFPVRGRQSSLAVEPYSEYTAGIYWGLLRPYFPRFFTWNTVPLHPYQKDKPLSIRNPTRSETVAYLDLIAGLLDTIQPQRVLAVGRAAEHALLRLGVEAAYVRHPSQGGANLFREGVRRVFEEIDAN